MTCAELADSYELHAMRLLEEPERAELEEHLLRGCEQCTQGMRRAMEINVSVMALAPEAQVPKRLRRRVLASVGVESPHWGWTLGWLTVTASLLVGVLWFSVQDRRRTAELAEARRAVAGSNVELTKAQEALAILNQPETKQVVFGGAQPAPPKGRIFIHRTGGVLLLAANLPPAGPGRTYELWVIPKGGAPRPAGLFQSDERGNAMFFSKGAVDVAALGAVAVSLEPESGSPAPTTTPVIVAPVGD